MDETLECTKCNSVVCVESNWYGTSRRFKFKCMCTTLDILSNASYIETFDEAISRIKEWKQHLTTASTRLASSQVKQMLDRSMHQVFGTDYREKEND